MPGAAKRPFGGIWNKGSRSGLGMFADGGEMHAECAAPNGAKAFLSYFLCPTKSREKVAARTCKKLPVASFCASETAETGRIANGREQGDHVGGDKAAKGFNWACAKLLSVCAESRFAKPRFLL